MSIKNADDLIIDTQNKILQKPAVDITNDTPANDSIESPTKLEKSIPESKNQDAYGLDNQQKNIENPESKIEKSEEADEYGNSVAKPKMFSQEEVENMIRDRLSRGRANQQQMPQQQAMQQQIAQDFQPDPASADNWEVQLEQFIGKTLNKLSNKQQSEMKMQQEQQMQQAFESKFTAGMSKYDDFQGVVGNKPITDSMMMATRNMENPAAFIYAACKMQPNEILRISQISDPIAQVVEIGRLDEKMRKAAKKTTSAPPPISNSLSDIPNNKIDGRRGNIDHLIIQHAKSNLRRR